MGAGIVGEQYDPAGDIDVGADVGAVDLNVAGQTFGQHEHTEFALHGVDRAAGGVDHKVGRIDAAYSAGNYADATLQQINDHDAKTVRTPARLVGELADAQYGAAFHAEHGAITQLQNCAGQFAGAQSIAKLYAHAGYAVQQLPATLGGRVTGRVLNLANLC